MKLIAKLTAALVAGTILVLAVNGYFRVQREVASLHADRVRDHALIGRALATAVATAWRADGRKDALHIIDAANAQEGTVHVRWLDAADGARIDPSTLAALPSAETITRLVGDDARVSYTAVTSGNSRLGFVELSEKLQTEHRAVRTIVSDTLVTTLMLVLVSGMLAGVLGVWLVGQPMRELCAKARRIGEGDFTHPLELVRHDEVGVLAQEMNATCVRLTEAAERVDRETAARIAMLEQLRHAERLTTVGKLASGVAHELGTPLNVVSARAKMIANGHTTEAEATKYAAVIAEAADRMTTIIRQMLAFARRKPSTKTPRDIGRIIAETRDLLRPITEKANVEIRVQDDAVVMAEVDGGGIQQVLTNILVNAVHAMPDGGEINVTVGHEARPAAGPHPGDFVVIRVRDSGMGISASDIEHVFEPFFTTKDVGHGTGLGLSVSFGIVEDHGGFIDVESEAGKGATFVVHLPASSV